MSGRRRNVNIGANSIVYSGRGRPRTKEIVDRPLPVGIVLGSPSPGSDIFKNRKIRVGGHFQAKVPKKPSMLGPEQQQQPEEGATVVVYQSSRKPPNLVSHEYPHLTRKEVELYEAKELQKQQQQKQQHHSQVCQGNENGEGPPTDGAMELDIGLSQTAVTATATTTTISAHSNNSVISNNTSSGSQKSATTDRQSNNHSNTDQETSVEGQSTATNNNNADGNENDDDEETLKTHRGGLLISPSTAASTTTTKDDDDEDVFWNYIQPLLVPPKEHDNNSKVDKATASTWQAKVLQWHLDKQQRAQQALEEIQRKQQEEAEQQLLLPRRRGRRKRRKDDTSSAAAAKPETAQDALDWYEKDMLANNNNNKSKKSTTKRQAHKRQRTEQQQPQQHGTDDDNDDQGKAHAMKHFWMRHQGQLGIAMVETRVQLSAGKAEMARRVRQHKRLKEAPSSLGGVFWRQYCAQSTMLPMIGDYRTSEDDEGSGKNAALSSSLADPYELEVHRETWKAILLLGQAIVEQLTKAGSSSRVPPTKLSLLLSFLNNAHQVRPLPEEIFRAAAVTHDINQCFDCIADHADRARKVQAKLMDALYETNHTGVDWDAVHKLLDQQGVRSLPVELDDAGEVHEQLALAFDWQNRLDALVGEDELCLSSLEDLAQEGRSFVFRSKSLVCLENRIQKAYQLRDRIVQWKKACEQCEENLDDKKETFKFLGAMVRDANRLKLKFPEVSDLLETHRTVEAWIDRANIAIRSRISLKEIKALVQKGEELPVNLSDLMEKLRSRVGSAEEWVGRFKNAVSCSNSQSDGPCLESGRTLLQWMEAMREALRRGKHMELHDLASEGSRIPVEVDLVKVLQIELDAKAWTTKAKKWVPSLAQGEEVACKKAKLEDLREHLDKGSILRERIELAASEKCHWELEGEKEIRAIVQAADDWFVKYKPYLDWDNRRSEGRSCLSMTTLRTICSEANAIYANIGNAAGKMARILTQAEDWQKKHEPLLLTCKIVPIREGASLPQDKSHVTLDGMTAAAAAAASEVSLDLDEAKELLKLADKVKDWTVRATNAAPKRSKRQSRGRKPKLTVDDIIGLIKEAEDLPVDTTEDVNRLQIQLSAVQEWRAKARQELENIYNGFQKLRHVADEMYGPPQEYTRKRQRPEATEGERDDKSDPDAAEEKKTAEDISQLETSEGAGAGEHDQEGMPSIGTGNCNVNQLIKHYRREALTHGVISGEVEAADQLEKISNWCVRSVKYLVTQRDVFDKRFFGAFDRFIAQGRGLLTPANGASMGEQIKLEDQGLAEKLNAAWSAVVSDQLQRLEVLLADREQFISWCNAAEALIGSKGEKKPPLDKLKELTDNSRPFPSVCDMVQKVRGIFYKAVEWKQATEKLLKGPKLSRNEAKSILDEGEKLGFVCEEMKLLRNALRLARNWANKVKRCDLDQGSTNATAVQALIDEHASLLLELPEELSMLQQAMKLYCVCRRPYSGFMIGCDECEEWYHGLCIGITESKADRVDKFVCVRCCVSRVFKNTAKEGVAVIKKWTCQKDMKRARQTESQRHQRKIRKETKEIEKQRAQIQTLESQQQQQQGEMHSEGVPNHVEGVPPLHHDGLTVNPLVTAAVSNQPTMAQQPSSSQEAAKPPVVPADAAEDKAKEEQPQLTPEEAQAKIQKCLDTIRKCNDRLSLLSKQTEERKELIAQEDAKASLLRNWFLRVRSLVLFPRSVEASEQGRPLKDGTLSAVMQSLIQNAEDLGISRLTDVVTMVNAFHCLSWCMLATATLARKPMFREIELLVDLAKPLRFTEEKAIRVVKGILVRAKAWQAKVMKALAPCPGEKKKFNLDSLKELESAAQDIPCHLKEVSLLNSVIEDNGSRYCICGGPSDAKVMLGCDKCERWFHGSCVDMTKEQCDTVQNWVCPPCSGTPTTVSLSKCAIVWDEVSDASSRKGKSCCEHVIASEAPNAAKMWPPFGLFDSTTALEMLGPECSALADAEEIIPGPTHVGAAVQCMQVHVPVPVSNSADSSAGQVMVPAVLPSSLEPATCGEQPSTTQVMSEVSPALPAAQPNSSETAAASASAGAPVKPVELPAFNWLAASGDLAAFAAQASLGSWQMALGAAGSMNGSAPAPMGLDFNSMMVHPAKPAADDARPTETETMTTNSGAVASQEVAASQTPTVEAATLPETLASTVKVAGAAPEQGSQHSAVELLPAEAVAAVAAVETEVSKVSSCHVEQALAATSEVQLPAAPAPMPPGLSLMVAALPLQEGGS